jgi:Na+-translocating ferredoxin:NAD+ oxidoreductase subunit B
MTTTTAHKDQIEAIENALPQTQCQLCDYQDCHAYAKAIVENHEHIDRCHPGGLTTLQTIADITQQDPAPYTNTVIQQTKAMTLAVIREEECIGCTKCIQACPVDAIIGSGQQMHTVITDACNGCERCIPPCPVDCIDTIVHPNYENATTIDQQSRRRYQAHQQRLEKWQQQGRKHYQHAKKMLTKAPIEARKAAIAAAIQRVKTKK